MINETQIKLKIKLKEWKSVFKNTALNTEYKINNINSKYSIINRWYDIKKTLNKRIKEIIFDI